MQAISLLEKLDQKTFWLNWMIIVSTNGNQDKHTAFKTSIAYLVFIAANIFYGMIFIPGLYSCNKIIIKHSFMITMVYFS